MLKGMLAGAVLFLVLLSGCQKAQMASPVLSSTEVGNGGHGIWKNGKLYLYDLWEAGIEDRGFPALSQFAGEHEGLLFFFRYHLGKIFIEHSTPRIPNETQILKELCRKFTEIYLIDPVLGLALLESAEGYQWIFQDKRLNPLSVPEPVHRHEKNDVVLLANRSGRSIFVDLGYLSKLDVRNAVAFFIHETVNSYLPVAMERTFSKSGKRARQITALLFGGVNPPRLLQEGIGHFLENDELPMRLDSSDNLPGYSFTNGFYSRISPKFRIHRDQTEERIVGPAALQLRSERGDSFTFSGQVNEVDIRRAARAFCEKEGPEFPKIVLVFQGSHSGRNPAYRIRYRQFSDKNDVKWHLIHEKVREPFIMEVATRSSINRPFFDPQNPQSELEKVLVNSMNELRDFLNPKAVTKEPSCEELIANSMLALRRVLYPEHFADSE